MEKFSKICNTKENLKRHIMKKYFALMCSLFKTHIKDSLVTIKTSYGYALFKKVDKKWYIGTISYIPKTKNKRVYVNLFTNKPYYSSGLFIIEDFIDGKEISIPLDLISFKPSSGIRYYHHGNWGWGYIKKSKIKQMSAL